MAEADRMTPLEAAQVIATAQVDAAAAKRRAAGYTDMLWGLLLPAILLSMTASRGDAEVGTARHAAMAWISMAVTYGLALGGLVLSYFVTRNQAISLAPPVRSVWFWVGLALLPFLLFVVVFASMMASFEGDGSVTPSVWRSFKFVALVTKWAFLAVGAAYVTGRGLHLRRQAWYGRGWAVGLGCGLALATTALVAYDVSGSLLGRIASEEALWITAALLGSTWFAHGVLLYNRG